MRSKMLRRGEVLKYEGGSVDHVVLSDDLTIRVGIVRDGDLVILVDDEKPVLTKVMIPNGKIGWVALVPWNFLEIKNARPVEV